MEVNVMIDMVASDAHDNWRAPRRIQGTNEYEARTKKTNDAKWIVLHGTDQVDISNTAYPDLPSDWQAENRVSAEIAIREITAAKKIDEQTVEMIASLIHDEWIKRNGGWATPELKGSYGELSEAEKEKDRFYVKRAIELCGLL